MTTKTKNVLDSQRDTFLEAHFKFKSYWKGCLYIIFPPITLVYVLANHFGEFYGDFPVRLGGYLHRERFP